MTSSDTDYVREEKSMIALAILLVAGSMLTLKLGQLSVWVKVLSFGLSLLSIFTGLALLIFVARHLMRKKELIQERPITLN